MMIHNVIIEPDIRITKTIDWIMEFHNTSTRCKFDKIYTSTEISNIFIYEYPKFIQTFFFLFCI